MATEHLFASSSVAGDADNPANATGTSDGTFTTDADNESWTHEWHLDDPTNSPDASQTITVDITCRKFDGNSNPTIDSVELLDGATSKGTDSTGWSVTSLTSEVIQASITASDWPSDGSDLRVKVVTTAAGGSPANRAAVQVDEFDVTLTTSVAVKDITPAAETVNVTAGGLTVTVGSVAITPAAETVSVTPGGVTVTIGDWAIVPTAETVTVTPGGVTVTTGSVGITPAAETVNVTAGGLTVTQSGGTQNIIPAAATVSATAGSMVLSLTPWAVTPTAETVTVTPGGVTVTTGAVAITPAAATVTASAGGLTITTGSVAIIPDAATVTVASGTLVVTQSGAGTQNIVPAAVTVTVSAGTTVVTVVGGVDRSQAALLWGEALMRFLMDNETFTSVEVVGALNEINGTTGKGHDEARNTYINS